MQTLAISHTRLRQILDTFATRRILILGDLGIDRYTEGTVERISPEAPVAIVAVKHERLKLGLAANVADNVRALGGEPILCGVIGTDRTASDFKSLLKKSKIQSHALILDPKRRTSLKERVVSEQQQLLRIDYESTTPISAVIEKRILSTVAKALSQTDALIIEDYAKGLLSQKVLAKVIAMAKKKRVAVLLDPNSKTPSQWYQGATVLTPNRKEAEALSGLSLYEGATLKQIATKIFSRSRNQILFITLGKDGMAVFERGARGPASSGFVIPTYAREVYDVSGAGDTVISALALALTSGANLQECAVIANLAAGIEVGKRGTAVVSRAEILGFAQQVFRI